MSAKALIVHRLHQAGDGLIGGNLFGLSAFLANKQSNRQIAWAFIQRHIGVEAFDPFDEAKMDQEIKRAVCGGRRDRANPVKRCKDFVSGQRPLGIEQHIEHVLADMGEALAVELRLIGGGLDEVVAGWFGVARRAPAAAMQAALTGGGRAGS